MARKSKKLNELINMFEGEEFIDEENIESIDLGTEFIINIKENAIFITEERQIGKVLHDIEQILLSVIFAVMANCNTFVEIHLFICCHYEWLNKHIKFENGIPSLSTIKRVIGFINPKELEEMCVNVVQHYLKKNEPLYRDGLFVVEDIKAMDGKTANSSDRKTSKNGSIAKTNAMSIQSVKNDYTEATEFIEKKTNEIPTGVDLLKRINIENSIIVFDAMSTQTATIDYIASKNAYYVAPVKGNQGILEELIKEYFDDKVLYEKAKKEAYFESIEKAHGGPERREYIFTSNIDWLYKKSEWNGLTSIGMAKRTYQDSEGNQISDIRYYISNLPSKRIEIISNAIRSEWNIEVKLHWYLDTVFKEDENKSFLYNSQKNLNIIRKFCLGLLKVYKEKKKLSLNSTRFVLSTDFERSIDELIATFNI